MQSNGPSRTKTATRFFVMIAIAPLAVGVAIVGIAYAARALGFIG